MAFQTYTKFAIIGIKFQLSCKHVHDLWPFHIYICMHCIALHRPHISYGAANFCHVGIYAELQNEADS